MLPGRSLQRIHAPATFVHPAHHPPRTRVTFVSAKVTKTILPQDSAPANPAGSLAQRLSQKVLRQGILALTSNAQPPAYAPSGLYFAGAIRSACFKGQTRQRRDFPRADTKVQVGKWAVMRGWSAVIVGLCLFPLFYYGAVVVPDQFEQLLEERQGDSGEKRSN